MEHDADATKELALMTGTRWHYELLAHIKYTDGLNVSGQIAAAVDTGSKLAFVAASVWADKLDISMCNKGTDVHFVWVCERAPCRLRVGESSWSLHKLPVRI